MVAIARDLTVRMNIGLWDAMTPIQAKQDWTAYYQELYFPDALTESQQRTYQSTDDVNSYKYEAKSFENESVQRENDCFIYTGELHDSLTDSGGKETTYISLYRVWIALDSETQSFKVKKSLGVDIKR